MRGAKNISVAGAVLKSIKYKRAAVENFRVDKDEGSLQIVRKVGGQRYIFDGKTERFYIPPTGKKSWAKSRKSAQQASLHWETPMQQYEEYCDEIKIVDAALAQLSPLENDILSSIYEKKHSALYTSMEFNMDRSTVYRIRCEALHKLWLYLF